MSAKFGIASLKVAAMLQNNKVIMHWGFISSAGSIQHPILCSIECSLETPRQNRVVDSDYYSNIPNSIKAQWKRNQDILLEFSTELMKAKTKTLSNLKVGNLRAEDLSFCGPNNFPPSNKSVMRWMMEKGTYNQVAKNKWVWVGTYGVASGANKFVDIKFSPHMLQSSYNPLSGIPPYSRPKGQTPLDIAAIKLGCSTEDLASICHQAHSRLVPFFYKDLPAALERLNQSMSK